LESANVRPVAVAVRPDSCRTKSAIATGTFVTMHCHGDAFHFARPITFPGAPNKPPNLSRSFPQWTERIHAVRSISVMGDSGIDHSRAAAILWKPDQQMIAVAPFQLRSGKPLAGKRASECATGLLSLCAKKASPLRSKSIATNLFIRRFYTKAVAVVQSPLAALHYGSAR